MTCKHCGRPGRKAFGGYCSRVHKKLDARPKVLILECAACGRGVRRTPSRVSRGGKVYCKRCSKNSGETHPRWKEGQYTDPAGYRHVIFKGSYVREHVLTWEQANKACILPEVAGIVHVHHINTNKADNRPLNLVLLSSKLHGRIHRWMDAGRWENAKRLLIKSLEQQSYFIQNPEALDWYRKEDLQNIVKEK